MKNHARLIYLLFISSLALSQTVVSQENPAITAAELQQHISFLASDDLAGRLPGTDGDRLAAGYILSQFGKAGLKPMAENGFQYFDVVTGVEAGPGNMLVAGDREGVMGSDFIPLSFSKNTKLEAEAVFVGYGFRVKNDTLDWDDFRGIDLQGKWAVVLRGEPGDENSGSPFGQWIGLREKVLTAKDHGAAGVIFVSGAEFDKEDVLMRMFYDKTTADAGIPVFHARRDLVDAMIGTGLAGLEQKILDGMSPHSFETGNIIFGKSDILHKKVRTMNVVGMIEGTDPLLKDEIVVIGAHYDHLGMGGPGSGSRQPDTLAVHNGADDNASGVAGIIEIAEKLSAERENLRRSIVVVAFGAEEMGLIGSKYFVEHPVIDMSKVVAMFNFDMIGRLSDEKSLAFGGTGTAVESEELIRKYLDEYGLEGSFSREGFGPSDHAAFYAEDKPVFFISTGAHQDYHTPADDVEFINFEGQQQVSDFACALIRDVANRNEALAFREAGSKTRSASDYRFKVTLGIVPDFTSSENNGLGVGGVRTDGPAEKAGMLKGDVIVAIDGMEITNIYDYMARLKKLEAGQIITVDVMRSGEKKVLLVQL